MKYLSICAALMLAAPATAQDDPNRVEGLAAWDRIFTVTSHPRCTNCHVGEEGQPMWQALGYGPDAVHGMNVRPGESRIGAESIPCDACHVTSAAANTVPHAPPHIDDAWRLPPVELAWLGKTSAEVCIQLRDPETSDGHDIASLVDHLQNSAFVNWGFAPGAGRSVPEGSLDALVHDVTVWGAAGTPCEGD
ncbi:MAG: hypothetical protein ABJG14_01070 [Sulfitobacter sp.]|uniref:hypothetical protein n=1 Tax=Sulfitobacter sp. TaxID=1903071 RepID=UPI0032633BAA